jgi:hypothetical protein
VRQRGATSLWQVQVALQRCESLGRDATEVGRAWRDFRHVVQARAGAAHFLEAFACRAATWRRFQDGGNVPRGGWRRNGGVNPRSGWFGQKVDFRLHFVPAGLPAVPVRINGCGGDFAVVRDGQFQMVDSGASHCCVHPTALTAEELAAIEPPL